MVRFAKIVSDWKLLTIFAKRSILDVSQRSEYLNTPLKHILKFLAIHAHGAGEGGERYSPIDFPYVAPLCTPKIMFSKITEAHFLISFSRNDFPWKENQVLHAVKPAMSWCKNAFLYILRAGKTKITQKRLGGVLVRNG